MKQLEVQIMGQRYVLGCPPGGESRLLEAVERVDTAMCIIRDGGKVRARDRIAVLAAVNLAFDLGDNGAVVVAAANGAGNGAAQSAEARRASSDADDNAMLSTLLERLDSALGEDGQLI